MKSLFKKLRGTEKEETNKDSAPLSNLDDTNNLNEKQDNLPSSNIDADKLSEEIKRLNTDFNEINESKSFTKDSSYIQDSEWNNIIVMNSSLKATQDLSDEINFQLKEVPSSARHHESTEHIMHSPMQTITIEEKYFPQENRQYSVSQLSTHNFALDQLNDYGFSEDAIPDDPKKKRWKESYKTRLIKRKQVWDKMIPKSEQIVNIDPKKLKKYVRDGIPAEFRAAVWFKVSGALAEQQEKPSYFKDILTICQSPEAAKTYSQTFKDINKDIDRTFPTHPLFKERFGLDSLKMVLKAYAVHNPRVGYCQSMNFVAATLLLFFNGKIEEVFWMLIRIVDVILPRNYYTNKMIDLQTDMLVLRHLMQKKLPAIIQTIERHNLDITIVSAGWFLTLYVNNLPMESVLRVWDALLLEDEDGTSLLHLLHNIGNTQYDCDKLLDLGFNHIGGLGRATIAELREKYRKQVLIRLENTSKRQAERSYNLKINESTISEQPSTDISFSLDDTGIKNVFMGVDVETQTEGDSFIEPLKDPSQLENQRDVKALVQEILLYL